MSFISKLSIFKEIWLFLKIRKKFWLMPVIIILVFLGIVLVFAETSVLGPLIYTIF